MKLGRVMLALVICLIVVGLLCPLAQADDSKVEVDLKVEIVSPPSVTTSVAWPVVWRLAILRGQLTDLGTAKTVNVYFEWGKTTDYGSTTRVRTIRRPRTFVTIITGLTPATTYHFRAVAVGDVTSYGEDKSFTTRERWRWKWYR